MKIAQHIKRKGASLSFEFFPPKNKDGEDRLFENITKLERLNPDFVSVTYGAGGGTLKNTREVVARIIKETSLVPMPHLTGMSLGPSSKIIVNSASRTFWPFGEIRQRGQKNSSRRKMAFAMPETW